MNKDEIKAAQVLQEAEKKRINECWKEIAVVLEKYNCKLDTDIRFLGSRLIRQVVILPKQDLRDPGAGGPVVE